MSLKLNDISLSSSTLKAGDRKSWKWPNGCDIVAMVTRTWTFFFFLAHVNKALVYKGELGICISNSRTYVVPKSPECLKRTWPLAHAYVPFS